MKIVFATRNRGKMRELAELVGPLDYELLSLDDVGFTRSIVEDEPGFEGNACKKARAVAEACRLPTIADDSGLEVDALGGAPGVMSARYAGPKADDAANNQKLLDALSTVADDARTARFRCSLAYVEPDKAPLVANGTCEGQVLRVPRGDGGFGYDPLFFVPELGKTFAELSVEEKNRLSHRAQAFRQMVSALASRRRII